MSVCVCLVCVWLRSPTYLCVCCFSNSGTTPLESVIPQIQFAQSNLHKLQSFQTSHFDSILLNFIANWKSGFFHKQGHGGQRKHETITDIT